MLPLIQTGGGATGTLPSTIAKVSSKWLDSYSSVTGLFTQNQPAFTDISGTATAAQIPSLDASKITTGLLATARGGPIDLTASGSGEFWSQTFFKPAQSDIVGSAAEGTANVVYLFRMFIPVTITIRKLNARLHGATVGGTWDVGLYDSAGNRLVSTGGTTTNSTALQTTTLGSPVTILPDVYYVAQTSSVNSIDVWSIIQNTTSLTFPAIYYTAANASSAGVLPATTGALTPVSGVLVYPPCVFFQS